MTPRLKHPFLPALSLNGPVLAIWYLLEAVQFGGLQHGRICDDVVFLVYFGITWALLRIMSKKPKPMNQAPAQYVAIIRGTGRIPPRYVMHDGSLTYEVEMAYPCDTIEDAKELSKDYENAEIMQAYATLTLTPIQ